MNGKLRYAKFAGRMEEAECARIRATDLYQIGDTVLVWVNEGDLCEVGQCMDTPPGRLRARQIIAKLCDDPQMWATHGMPGDAKLKRLEDELTAAFNTSPDDAT